MLNETQLKEKLRGFAQNDFRFSESEDLSEIILAMLNHIGSTDSFLRDDLIYSAFGTWILRDNMLDHEQLRYLLSKILDEQHMFYEIGEQNTDSVFRRSFSVLILPLMLIAHRSHSFLTMAEIYQIKEKLLYYLMSEKDCRGFIAEKGWAHSIAHAADALDDLAQCSELNQFDLAEILVVIHHMICTKEASYVHSEEERIVTAVIAIVRRKLLSDVEIVQWIQSFVDCTLQIKSMPEGQIVLTNTKSFLQSMYFRLLWENITAFDTSINQALKKINPCVKAEGG